MHRPINIMSSSTPAEQSNAPPPEGNNLLYDVHWQQPLNRTERNIAKSINERQHQIETFHIGSIGSNFVMEHRLYCLVLLKPLSLTSIINCIKSTLSNARDFSYSLLSNPENHRLYYSVLNCNHIQFTPGGLSSRCALFIHSIF